MGGGQGRTLGVMRKSSGWRSMGPPGRPNQAAILGHTCKTGRGRCASQHAAMQRAWCCMCKGSWQRVFGCLLEGKLTRNFIAHRHSLLAASVA